MSIFTYEEKPLRNTALALLQRKLAQCLTTRILKECASITFLAIMGNSTQQRKLQKSLIVLCLILSFINKTQNE